jgi:signal transduction histidine kinase
MPIVDEQGRITGSTAALVEIEGLTGLVPGASPNTASASQPQEEELISLAFDTVEAPLVVLSGQGLVVRANRAAVERATGAPERCDFVEAFATEPDRTSVRDSLDLALRGAPEAQAPLQTCDRTGQWTSWRVQALGTGETGRDLFLLSGQAALGKDGPEPSMSVEDDGAPGPMSAVPALRETDESLRFEEIGRLSAGLAQDFGGLLAVMTSALQMVGENAGQPDKVRRLSDAALKAGRRGEVLTRQMAALTSGSLPLPDQPIDAAVLLRALEGRLILAVQASARESHSRPCDLMIVVPPETPPVRLDPVAFEAAITALVVNAAQAGANSVSVEILSSDEGVKLVVRDDGSGMDEETQKRAAEPFFTTRMGSAGLGLTQARALAQGAGGELTVASTPGRGTEVRLNLPGFGA